MSEITRRALVKAAAASGLASIVPTGLRAQTAAPAAKLIRGANIFDGSAAELIAGADVLIENGMISMIGQDLPASERHASMA
ncbi:MAG: hypothetical protein ACR2QJ_08420 [Geminicoccaceae bacterium]